MQNAVENVLFANDSFTTFSCNYQAFRSCTLIWLLISIFIGAVRVYLEFLLLYNISQYLSCVNFSKGNAIVKPKPVVDIDEGTTVTEEERRKVIAGYLNTSNELL